MRGQPIAKATNLEPAALRSRWGFALMRESLSFACPNESDQRKGHPVLRRCFASVPCAAPAESGPPETRRAARDSNIRRSFSLSASTARRCAQGRNTNPLLPVSGGFACIPSRYTATQARSGDGCPAHCAGAASLSEGRQSGPSSGRIPSPRASACTGASRRRVGCPFLGSFFWARKRRNSHCSAKLKPCHPVARHNTPDSECSSCRTPE